MTILADIAKAQAKLDADRAQVLVDEAALNAAKLAYAQENEVTFCIIDECNFSADEMKTILEGSQKYISEFATDWGFSAVHVTTTPSDTSIPVYITTRRGLLNIAARHTLDSHKPAIYVKPGTAYSRWGYYHPKLGIITGKMFGNLCHELLETLANPMLNTYSMPDKQGRKWYREVADHVFGTDYMEVVNGHNCIFPNYALPSFYDLNGKAPFDKRGVVTAPFTMTPKGYGWYLDPVTKVLTKF